MVIDYTRTYWMTCLDTDEIEPQIYVYECAVLSYESPQSKTPIYVFVNKDKVVDVGIQNGLVDLNKYSDHNKYSSRVKDFTFGKLFSKYHFHGTKYYFITETKEELIKCIKNSHAASAIKMALKSKLESVQSNFKKAISSLSYVNSILKEENAD